MLLPYYPMIPHQISTSRWCCFSPLPPSVAAVAQVEGGTPRPGHAVVGPRLMRTEPRVCRTCSIGYLHFNILQHVHIYIYIYYIYTYSYVTHTRSYGYILKYIYKYRIVKITYISNIGSSGASPLTMAPMTEHSECF